MENGKYIGSWSTNTLIVHVFYQNDRDEIFHKEIPYVFISGWDTSNHKKGYGEKIESCFDRKRVLILGDFYELPPGQKIGRTNNGEIKSKKEEYALINDFNERGVELHGDSTFDWNGLAHSEQALISYIKRGHEIELSPAIDHTVVPKGITLLMISRNDPCCNCSPLLQKLIMHEGFRKAVLKKMFPLIDTTTPSLKIVYGYYNHMGTTKGLKREEEDLINSIDFSRAPSYILVGEDKLRGERGK